jgi:multidrug efflux pump subunit AcrB
VKRLVFHLIHNPLLVNLIMGLILLFGVITMTRLNREMFPSVVLDQVQVSVVYPGASALEVEQGILLKLDDAIEGIPEIDEVLSSAQDNFARMTIVLDSDANLQERLQEIKTAVDGIIGLPVDAEQPVVASVRRTSPVITMLLYGDTDLEALRQEANRVKDELLELPAVSLVSVGGVPEREISIEASEGAMQRWGISFDEISKRVRETSLDRSGGSLKTPDEELKIRVYGRKYTADEFSRIPLRVMQDGTVLYLEDVAEVREDWVDSPNFSWFNSKPSVQITVSKTDAEDSMTIVKDIRHWLDVNESALPTGCEIEILRDSTIALKQRIALMLKNGFLGLILVAFTLTIFLNLRLSFWVAMGIPISYAGMFFLFGFTPATINVISLFGMILVLGIVVDDAIVVGENIFQHVEKGVPPEKAALRGTMEVLPAVTASVSTTIIAFIPFFYIEGRMGMFIWQMALAVILALIISLFECLFILPPHLAHTKALSKKALSQPSKLRRKLDGWIHTLIHGFYKRTLNKLLDIHWVTVTLGLAIMLLTFGAIKGGHVPFTFFPRIDVDDVRIQVEMTAGTREARTLEVLRAVEASALALRPQLQKSQLDGQQVLESTSISLGPGSEKGTITLKLLTSEDRDQPAQAVTRMVKKTLPHFPDIEEVSAGAMGRHFGSPVAIRLQGRDIEALDRAADDLIDELKGYDALTDVEDDRASGKRELRLRLTREGEALGLSLGEASRQIRQAFYGQEILRFQRERDEIRVWTRLREEDRSSVEELKRLQLRTPSGALVPFSSVLNMEMGRGLVEIKRFDGKRVVGVTADVDNMDPEAKKIIGTLKESVVPELMKRHPNVQVAWGGEQDQQSKSTGSMKYYFPMALLLIGFILIMVFRSISQMMIVLSMIPLGLVGAILGHLVLGKSLTILSIFGLVGLSGIVINDSLVFVDRINRELKNGLSVRESVIQAGMKRFRPILLTTFTTVAGMLPIILETSRQAQFLIPMAITVSFGLLFGTMLTVYILPAQFLVINDLRCAYASYKNRLAGEYVQGKPLLGHEDRFKVTPESVEPAIRRPVLEFHEDLC